jgi:hypothetical protein
MYIEPIDMVQFMMKGLITLMFLVVVPFATYQLILPKIGEATGRYQQDLQEYSLPGEPLREARPTLRAESTWNQNQ